MTDVDGDVVLGEHAGASSRRGMLRVGLAGLAAAFFAASRATPAEAATGSTVLVGHTDNWANNDTTIVHNNISGTSNGPGFAGVRDSGSTTGVDFSENCGVLGQTNYDGQAGVVGFGSGGPGSIGVDGWAYQGFGTLGHTTIGAAVGGMADVGSAGVVGRFEGGRAQLFWCHPLPPVRPRRKPMSLANSSWTRTARCSCAARPARPAPGPASRRRCTSSRPRGSTTAANLSPNSGRSQAGRAAPSVSPMVARSTAARSQFPTWSPRARRVCRTTSRSRTR